MIEAQYLVSGYYSDDDSIHSDVTATLSSASDKKEGSGRRKQSAPRRAAMGDLSDCTQLRTIKKMCPPSRLATNSNDLDENLRMMPAAPVIPVATHTLAHQPASTSARGKKNKQDLAGPCCHCSATSSPQWRKGPKGKPILCNACGIRFLRNRTLSKVVSKKRRGGLGGGVESGSPQIRRVRHDDPATEDEDVQLATDEVLAPEHVVAAEHEASEDAHSNSHMDRGGSYLLPQQQQYVQQQSYKPISRLAAVSHSMEIEADDNETGAAMLLAGAAPNRAGVSNPNACSNHDNVLGPTSTGTQQPLAAGSRHILLGAGSSSFAGGSSKARKNPSLTMALAQQQYVHHYAEQQHPGSPAKVGFGFEHSATSPISNASAYQHLASDYSMASGSPPASPLLLNASCGGATASSTRSSAAGSTAIAANWARDQTHVSGIHGPSPLSIVGDAISPAAAAAAPGAAVPPGQPADMLQLVSHMATVLGGIGPALEFIKAINTGRALAANAYMQ